jgi:hypothetical protein
LKPNEGPNRRKGEQSGVLAVVRRSKIQLELAFAEVATGEARNGLGEGTGTVAANAEI